MKCAACNIATPVIKRSSSRLPYCRECFTYAFEEEVYKVIEDNKLIVDDDVVCIGVSGGKDSSVLAHVLATLKERHNRNWTLHLLAADEGIKGYRDDSLNVVLNMKNPNYDGLKILNFKERFGFTMDEVVALIGQKSNCTVCGTFRRQILEIGARLLGANKLCTGHNIDDNAETVLLNICRNDLFKLAKNLNTYKGTKQSLTSNHETGQSEYTCDGAKDSKESRKHIKEYDITQLRPQQVSETHTAVYSKPSDQAVGWHAENMHSTGLGLHDMHVCKPENEKTQGGVSVDIDNAASDANGTSEQSLREHVDNNTPVLKRIKPMMYCFEKEIVMYARYKKLEYFSTECIYAPEAYRGYMRTFIKQLEAVDPRIIENITHSSQHFYAEYSAGKAMKNCQKCGIQGINDICKACLTVDKLSSLKLNTNSHSRGIAKCHYTPKVSPTRLTPD
ncbi:PP-loop family protein [Babesia divergens]|uniref:Cytoplasmic tRNA 2-thiolation protein 1 n=1 Tax=Babesia divergens TaxID=32595 RepID=A0AAD9G807_BABDI|nr:PP-loop family protein [Babesia divergens]